MQKETTNSLKKFRQALEVLKTLSPDRSETVATRLFSLSKDLSEKDFSEFKKFAKELISLYIHSPIKISERFILHDYFKYIENSAKLLEESGEITKSKNKRKNISSSLVTDNFYSSLDWCKIMSGTKIPGGINRAVNALSRRKDVISSVIEIMFDLLHNISADKTYQWQLSLIESKKTIDSDIIRDLIRSWKKIKSLPSNILETTLSFSEDEQLYQKWPSITKEADALVRTQSLRRWKQKGKKTSGITKHLEILYPYTNDKKLERWLFNAYEQMADHITFFVSEKFQDISPEQDSWQQNAAFQELKGLEQIFTPLLLLSDLHIDTGSHSKKMAMAFLGFSPNVKKLWEDTLYGFSADHVRIMFLDDLKNNRPPEGTIKKLSFGDDVLFKDMMAQLDLLTKRFDSVKQRELIVDRLAFNYSSYCEQKLLEREITKRFRKLMKTIHIDNLSHILNKEQLKEIETSEILVEYSSIAGESRKFLQKYSNMRLTTEELIASEMNYIRAIKKRRAYIVHRLK
ncbi:MAG: hypothetical protein U9O87_03030 [Verrucomicrobiota bacterium]|nr:hypothetical protein [Verrucomicrobiota bacterium]